MKPLSIAVAQPNFTVGDVKKNLAKITDYVDRAKKELGCRAIVFPELSLTGYPPEDLLLRTDFLQQVDDALLELVARIDDIHVIVGHPLRDNNQLFNAASVIYRGELIASYRKRELPNFGVFEEKRYFSAGHTPCVVDIDHCKVGVTICEDIWHRQPAADSVAAGAQLIVNLNASPFNIDKAREREVQVVSERAREVDVPIVYVNLVGGQDELVFDGGSFVVNSKGQTISRGHFFQEDLFRVVINDSPDDNRARQVSLLSNEASVYQALCLGVKDYVHKNGFSGAVLGLSGGIDSALTLAIAADALGSENVQAVLMPSQFTRAMSIEDAQAQALSLGVAYEMISIEHLVESYRLALDPLFAGLPKDTTEENLQSRIRGNLLMAMSNKTGKIVLTTGNKSEMAVGYATLYGDMAGGFAVIKDVPKTVVFALARYRNQQSAVIPKRVITRPPSAELAPDQEDTDSLPPYEILDPILEDFIENDLSPAEIAAKGFNRGTVDQIVRMVVRNEHKRRQAPPGVRVTRRAFGRDRRYPITSGFS